MNHDVAYTYAEDRRSIEIPLARGEKSLCEFDSPMTRQLPHRVYNECAIKDRWLHRVVIRTLSRPEDAQTGFTRESFYLRE